LSRPETVMEREVRFGDLKEEVQKELFALFGVAEEDKEKVRKWRLVVLSKEKEH